MLFRRPAVTDPERRAGCLHKKRKEIKKSKRKELYCMEAASTVGKDIELPSPTYVHSYDVYVEHANVP